jgi:hypothetical protein
MIRFLILTGSDADAILVLYGDRNGSQCGSEYADDM